MAWTLTLTLQLHPRDSSKVGDFSQSASILLSEVNRSYPKRNNIRASGQPHFRLSTIGPSLQHPHQTVRMPCSCDAAAYRAGRSLGQPVEIVVVLRCAASETALKKEPAPAGLS